MARAFFIGPFSFFDVEQFPTPAATGVSIENRPGVDYHSIWKTGTRGQPVAVTSFRDCLNWADVLATYNNYRAIIGTSVNVTWGDYNPAYQYDVLDVTADRGGLRQTALGVGGVLGVSYGLIVVQWTLIQNDLSRA